MIRTNRHVGRLIEVRFVSPISDDDLTQWATMRLQMRGDVTERLVCMDVTRMSVLPPAISERLLEGLRAPTPGLIRRAFLLPPKRGVVALQIERLSREALVPTRAFVDRAGLIAWLCETATPEEAARLRAFLMENPTT